MGTASAGGAWWLLNAHGTIQGATGSAGGPAAGGEVARRTLPDLEPARWVWYPSERCLSNTMVLFRREIAMASRPVRASGWILADSRYKLFVNGQRVQFGPAPCDPRSVEIDPVELGHLLVAGPNVIGAQVLYYGFGDGTWPAGKPGFLFRLEIEGADGAVTTLVSDRHWQACLARAWRPGQYKRWYLRALQEEFDSRLYPYGWDTPGYRPGDDWLAAMELDCPPDRPAMCSSYPDYQFEQSGDRDISRVLPRMVPMMRESIVPAAKLTEQHHLRWRRTPQEYFECMTPGAFEAFETGRPVATDAGGGAYRVEPPVGGEAYDGAAMTFEFAEQIVGWPRFTIEAPAGTVVEMLVHEAHEVGGPVLINSHFHAWTRFVCREGVNEFETFDFESLRWLQLHIHGAAGSVLIRDVGVRRRVFPWPHDAVVRVDEPALQRLVDATVNTLDNCAQENLVDGMARERQQYSGDCGHQLHAIYLARGETRLPARYLRTYSDGLTVEGYFLDCWPAYDRLCRVSGRMVNLAYWGPILDHGVGFAFDCLHHLLYTGRRDDIVLPFERLMRFARYLERIRGADGLLPVEGLGVPCVWIDHLGFARQRHKQCAFNLYAAAMLEHAMATLCSALGDAEGHAFVSGFGRALREAAIRRFWSDEHGLFVDNLPWLKEEGEIRLHDRTLATSLLFDQAPRSESAVRALVECPPQMGFSYPANAGWRLWALGKAGRADVILNDLRTRWATMDSVRLNNTLSEDWHAKPDSGQQWSHCPVVPVYILYMSIAGIRPTAPGFTRCDIRPQLADLNRLELVARTVIGDLCFTAAGPPGDRQVAIATPPGCEAHLIVRQGERIDLPPAAGPAPEGHVRYLLPAGRETRVRLKQS